METLGQIWVNANTKIAMTCKNTDTEVSTMLVDAYSGTQTRTPNSAFFSAGEILVESNSASNIANAKATASTPAMATGNVQPKAFNP